MARSHHTEYLKIPSDSEKMNRSHTRTAILVLTLCAAFLFYKYIIQNFPSVISGQLMSDFNLQGLGLGMLSGGYFWTYLLAPLFVGIIIDRYGARWVTTLAILSCAASVVWFSKTHTLTMAIIARAVMGIGVSFSTVAYMKLAATWFPAKRYALLIGLLVSAAMAGAVCGQMPFAWLIQHVGWRTGLYDVGLAGFVLAFIFMIVVREAPAKSGVIGEVNEAPISMQDVLHVFKSKQNWLLMLYSGLSFSPVVIFCGLWGNPFLQRVYHLDAITSSSLISFVFIGLAIGSPVFALFSNRKISKCHLMIYSTLLSSVALGLVLYCHPMPAWGLGVLLFIFGFMLGSFSLVFVIGKEVNPIRLAGTAIAMINASEALLDAITEPAIGRILDVLNNSSGTFSPHSYHIALAILPIYQIIGSVLLLWVKEQKTE